MKTETQGKMKRAYCEAMPDDIITKLRLFQKPQKGDIAEQDKDNCKCHYRYCELRMLDNYLRHFLNNSIHILYINKRLRSQWKPKPYPMVRKSDKSDKFEERPF